MKVLGIGNAIVDVICKVEESFISENNLAKSTMKLVDEVEFKKLLSNLKIEQTIAIIQDNKGGLEKYPKSRFWDHNQYCASSPNKL